MLLSDQYVMIMKWFCGCKEVGINKKTDYESKNISENQ